MPRTPRLFHTGLTADLYHPDAAYVAWRSERLGAATFDLYARRAPFGGAYMLTAGLEPALEFLDAFSFSDEEIAFLAGMQRYDPAFLDFLARLRFTGEVMAMPEGTIAFPAEPILRVTAPYAEALLVESGLLQAINAGTLCATKAARIVRAARGRGVAEFALRRALEPYTVARASFIGGCASTSFLAAAFEYGLKPSGTIPHALVELFDAEEDAFRAVAQSFPRYTLLLDTYDTRRAIHTAVEVGRWSRDELGHVLAAVRIDGGDLGALACYAREVLDGGGLQETRILLSGDLDEFRIVELLDAGVPVDGFGIGTALGIPAGSLDHGIVGGALGGVYKLAWYERDGVGRPAVKVAGEKSTWPGKKQVYRVGVFQRDVIALEDEPAPEDACSLLVPVMRDGKVIPGRLPPLDEVREHAQRGLAQLPQQYGRLSDAPVYRVHMSEALEALRERAAATH